jgi:hypothetical protein
MTFEVDALVAAWIAAFDRADLSELGPWCRPDLIVHAPAAQASAPDGLDRIALLLGIYRRAFPDGRFAIERIDREASMVSCAWIARGVNSDDLIEQVDGLLPAPGRMLASADAVTRRALAAWIDALTGGPKVFDAIFSPDVVVHAQCFGWSFVERGLASLDQVLAVVQSIVADMRVSIREHVGQGRTATGRARLAGRAGGAARQWALDCMLRAEGERVAELWLRIEERCGDAD